MRLENLEDLVRGLFAFFSPVVWIAPTDPVALVFVVRSVCEPELDAARQKLDI